jgi:hypothetical protein
VFAGSTLIDGKPSTRAAAPIRRLGEVVTTLCFYACFFWSPATHPGGTGVASIQATHLTKENIMKLQFGQNQLVLELSKAPFAWFHGQTERMSLTSLSLMFVQFSLFARQPAA